MKQRITLSKCTFLLHLDNLVALKWKQQNELKKQTIFYKFTFNTNKHSILKSHPFHCYIRLSQKFVSNCKKFKFYSPSNKKKKKIILKIKTIFSQDFLPSICKLSDLVKVPFSQLRIQDFLTRFLDFIKWVESAAFQKVLHWAENEINLQLNIINLE